MAQHVISYAVWTLKEERPFVFLMLAPIFHDLFVEFALKTVYAVIIIIISVSGFVGIDIVPFIQESIQTAIQG